MLLILVHQSDGTFARTSPVEKRNQGDTDESESRPKNHEGNTFNQAHTVRLTKSVTIPAMSQMAVYVVLSTAAGLVYLEPQAACGRSYLEPTTGAATKVRTGRPSGHPRTRGDGGDSFRRCLGYDETDAGQA